MCIYVRLFCMHTHTHTDTPAPRPCSRSAPIASTGCAAGPPAPRRGLTPSFSSLPSPAANKCTHHTPAVGIKAFKGHKAHKSSPAPAPPPCRTCACIHVHTCACTHTPAHIHTACKLWLKATAQGQLPVLAFFQELLPEPQKYMLPRERDRSRSFQWAPHYSATSRNVCVLTCLCS